MAVVIIPFEFRRDTRRDEECCFSLKVYLSSAFIS